MARNHFGFQVPSFGSLKLSGLNRCTTPLETGNLKLEIAV